MFEMVSFCRMEFKAYTDVKPVKPIKAKSQYKLAMGEKTDLETSYKATYKGEQAKPESTDNKLLERRRIRSLYNEPSKVCKWYSPSNTHHWLRLKRIHTYVVMVKGLARGPNRAVT